MSSHATSSGAVASGSNDNKKQPKSRGARALDAVGEKAGEILLTRGGVARSKEDLGNARKGIVYFLSHRSLWKPFLSRLGPILALSAGVVGSMFAFTYLPQLAVLVFVNGPFAVVSTVLLVLSESSAIINTVSRGWLLQDAILDTFDGTLVSRDAAGIVAEGRELKAGGRGGDPMKRLGKVLRSPFDKFGPKAMIRYLLYLPLNFIPIVGTVAFVFLQGRNRGRSIHERYFQLKKWSNAQKTRWVDTNVGAYTSFGLVATVLEMIPIASMFFTYTNTVGAALWAADIEAHSTSLTKETAPNLRAAADKATEKSEL
ncbi:protein family CysZ [Cordyceps javanica]|uniref:Protein family CysZ n=1 Tax=Cordyceps javanica TaxID=43265 RepID=A0A545UV23_9HYPO|nr:protein family CysZ [Cordyceps javanica]TQW05324.1 protein family CysZ [Cordyceps javanica]